MTREHTLFVGRNAEIKRYDATPAGQPLELFGEPHARVPIVLELLKSPWIVRASELVRRDGTCAAKHAEEPVEVVWDSQRQCPLEFTRMRRDRAKRYRIDGIVQVWASERAWWDPRRHVSRRFWRVLARGGVYDLAYDRVDGSWRLIGIQD